MFEIVILSGKGGTGKTSVAASLAVLAGNEAVIADCDVDAANMHLLLNPDYAQSFDFYGGELAVINQDSCSSCGICSGICRFDAIPFTNGQYLVSELDCEGCGYCERACPEHTITMQPRRSGNFYISQTRCGNPMVHARLDTGAENSGKLVARVKKEAQAIAQQQNKKFIIVDGSPGIGCPVTSSLAGANYVLLVTEPTLSGLHDLKRICTLINRFRVRTGCIINKHDLNPENTAKIVEFLSKEGIDHLADIGFDPLVPLGMLQGKTMVETPSKQKTTLSIIWEKINKQ